MTEAWANQSDGRLLGGGNEVAPGQPARPALKAVLPRAINVNHRSTQGHTVRSCTVTRRTQECACTSGHLVHRRSWANAPGSGAGSGSRSTSLCLGSAGPSPPGLATTRPPGSALTQRPQLSPDQSPPPAQALQPAQSAGAVLGAFVPPQLLGHGALRQDVSGGF